MKTIHIYNETVSNDIDILNFYISHRKGFLEFDTNFNSSGILEMNFTNIFVNDKNEEYSVKMPRFIHFVGSKPFPKRLTFDLPSQIQGYSKTLVSSHFYSEESIKINFLWSFAEHSYQFISHIVSMFYVGASLYVIAKEIRKTKLTFLSFNSICLFGSVILSIIGVHFSCGLVVSLCRMFLHFAILSSATNKKLQWWAYFYLLYFIPYISVSTYDCYYYSINMTFNFEIVYIFFCMYTVVLSILINPKNMIEYYNISLLITDCLCLILSRVKYNKIIEDFSMNLQDQMLSKVYALIGFFSYNSLNVVMPVSKRSDSARLISSSGSYL